MDPGRLDGVKMTRNLFLRALLVSLASDASIDLESIWEAVSDEEGLHAPFDAELAQQWVAELGSLIPPRIR